MTDQEFIDDRQIAQFNDQGFFIARGLFSTDEVADVRNEISTIMRPYPNVPDGLVQMEPTVRRGEVTPVTPELGVRKLFRMTAHSAFFRHLAFHPGMIEIATTLTGPDIALFQSMLLMKPPHFGGQKIWHQDNAYFRLVPNTIVGFWVACDDADPENGCMHVIPGSHRNGITEHGGVADDYGMLQPPSLTDAHPCPLREGDALVFHGELWHYTPPNDTDRRRRAIQYHYAPTRCRSAQDSPFDPKQYELVVAGEGAEDP